MNGTLTLGVPPPPLSVEGNMGKGILSLCGCGSWTYSSFVVICLSSLSSMPGYSHLSAFFSGEKVGGQGGDGY